MRILTMLAMLIIPIAPAVAEVVTVNPSQDTTIFQNNVSNSLGGGQAMFVGTNTNTSPRRGLIQFDLTALVPTAATIDSVDLTLYYAGFAGAGMGGGNAPLLDISLHLLTSAWGEGTVGAGMGTGGTGQGFPANAGDATWSQSLFGTTPWNTLGGDFVATASAVTAVGGTTLNIPFHWTSTPQLVADVQSWVDDPSTNHGWLLKGSESAMQTARLLWTSEAAANLLPVLTIKYTAVPEATTSVMLCIVALGLFSLMLLKRTHKASHA